MTGPTTRVSDDIASQQLGSGPSTSACPVAGPTAATSDSDQFAAQLIGFSDGYYRDPYTMDNGTYSNDTGLGMFDGTDSWSGLQQIQLAMPETMWQGGTWNRLPGQHLQQVSEGS